MHVELAWAVAAGGILVAAFVVRRARRAARAYDQQMAQLRHQLQRSQQLGLVGQMSAAAAHDLGNGQQIVLAWLHALEEAPDDERVRDRAMSGIRTASEHQRELCRRILRLSEPLEPGRPAVFDACRLLTDLEPSLRAILDDDVVLSLDVPADAAWIECDRTEFDQIMLNLVINARDAMPLGGRLNLRVTRTGHDVVIEVADDGTGFDTDTGAKIFDPFFTTKTSSGGTGLGLSASREIAESRGGTITAESAPGVGTTMRLWLPAVSPGDAVIDLRDAPAATNEPATVLVVDHDDDARGAIELMLRTAGFEVIGRSRTEDALIHLAGSDPIDLVLIDAVMPGMPATRILNAIAALRPGAAVGVLSAHRSEDLEQRGIDPDVMTVIRKPIDRPELLDALRLLLSGRTVIA